MSAVRTDRCAKRRSTALLYFQERGTDALKFTKKKAVYFYGMKIG